MQASLPEPLGSTHDAGKVRRMLAFCCE